jgi:histidinol-phosphatase
MAGFNNDLRLAHALADIADGITVKRFQARDLVVRAKPDMTPVTDADELVEKTLRGELARLRPQDALYGEEFGQAGTGPRCWVIDPIDGTSNFVRGVPVWATMIALMVDGEPVAGVVSAPLLDRRWWAAGGSGAWAGPSLSAGRRCQVSRVRRLPDAVLSYSSLLSWKELGLFNAFVALTREVWSSRAFGDFWSHMLVAEGVLDIAAEPGVSLWDVAALQIIVEEAGGMVTDLSGLARPGGGSAVSTNGHLHPHVLGLLGGTAS